MFSGVFFCFCVAGLVEAAHDDRHSLVLFEGKDIQRWGDALARWEIWKVELFTNTISTCCGFAASKHFTKHVYEGTRELLLHPGCIGIVCYLQWYGMSFCIFIYDLLSRPLQLMYLYMHIFAKSMIHVFVPPKYMYVHHNMPYRSIYKSIYTYFYIFTHDTTSMSISHHKIPPPKKTIANVRSKRPNSWIPMRAPRRSFGGKFSCNIYILPSDKYIHMYSDGIFWTWILVVFLGIIMFFFNFRFCEYIQMLMMNQLSRRHLLILLCLSCATTHQFKDFFINSEKLPPIYSWFFSLIHSSTVGVPINKNPKRKMMNWHVFFSESKTSFHWKFWG